MPPALLDPRNDFVFKRLFTHRPELLAGLINAVRSEHEARRAIGGLTAQAHPHTAERLGLDLRYRHATATPNPDGTRISTDRKAAAADN